MEEKWMPKKVLKDKMLSTKRKGRPRKHWIDDVEQDLRTMEVRMENEGSRSTRMEEGY
jgi:hypothetical protein